MTEVGQVQQFMGATLANSGFALEAVDSTITYLGRPAWAVYYRGADCKLQICWSSREGGIDFMLAPLDAPNEFGLINRSKKWQFMLALSDLNDDLVTPPVDAPPDIWWAWRIALFNVHIETARSVLHGK
ncbi:hypothetical protein JRC04_15520 [Mycolicibacterium sp. S2-37]|uniref:hypothetical protein n=1 Tax=Mycolicibacterium sp. S2-37 TaxID=2810297 RepID=UPI001A93AC38|nr:hypothetical protein [Mycolicibacterium sp. S2-37]MBO0678874.1 hypothetical protein [Mycolicibacterium sp. S2-37]